MEYKINQELLSQLDAEIDAMMSEVVENRRYLHMHPEIGFDTVGTEKMVKKILSDNQIEILDTKLGVLGVIPGKNRKRMIALRADMDALCLQEENSVSYKSLYENKMHACGHDGHTAMLLGAAKLLQRHREELETDVLLIFQPAEEGPTPGGAKLILEEMKKLGLLEKTERIFGQHLFNNYPCGMVGYKFGAKASSTDEFYIKVIGKGGHAGLPHQTIDALSIGAKIVTAMESFMSRRIDPFDSAVFSVGIFESGSAINIVADSAKISGTIRCQKDETRAYILKNMEQIVNGLCQAYGATCKIDIIHGLPVQMNDAETTEYAKKVVEQAIGKEKTFEIPQPMMGAEDFSYYAQVIPASFVDIGSANAERNLTVLGHNPKFDFDEEAMKTGIKVLCSLAFSMK